MVKIRIAFCRDVYVRMMHFERAGDVEKGHAHKYDHSSLLAAGSVKARVNGRETVFHAPTIIHIKKGLRHRFEALEDNTLLTCVHAIRSRDGSGDILDPAGIPAGVAVDQVAESMLLRTETSEFRRPTPGLIPIADFDH
jgi:hypothetical protein